MPQPVHPPFPAVHFAPDTLLDGKPIPDGRYVKKDVHGSNAALLGQLAQFLPAADDRFVAVVVKGGFAVEVEMAGDELAEPPSGTRQRVLSPSHLAAMADGRARRKLQDAQQGA